MQNAVSPARSRVLLAGIRDGLPIGLGYLAVSFSLGIAARNAGLNAFQGFLISLLNNASAGEYAAFTVIAADSGFLEMALITLITNARYLLMSCSLSQKFSPDTPLIHRLLVGYDVTDELFGIAISRPGGDDYLVKPFSSAELLMRVESLLRRYRVYKGKINGKILRQDIVLDEENRRVLRDGAAVELTETEFSILQYLAAQKGKVVSVNDIYENVWHEKYMPASNNTVMVHIVNLRKKLERNPAEPRLIRTVWGKGYQID